MVSPKQGVDEMFREKLPFIRTLRTLANMDGPFPMQSRRIVAAAERLWFGGNVIAFLRLFPPDEVFRSRDDFIERCRQLERCIREGRRAPKENLRSPQG